MKSKKILFDKEARQKLAEGADILARSVVSTLGPRSRNVAINRAFPGPWVLHDGVNIARSIKLEDPFQDMGAALLREAASKTNDLAGDGTTTATLLANTLIQEGLKLMEGGTLDGVITAAPNPMLLKDQLADKAKIICEKLTEMTIPVTTPEQVEQIATISSGYEKIGKIVSDAFKKVGNDGMVMIEESSSFETTLEFREGMDFENGYLSPFFVNTPNRMTVEYEDCYVLLTTHVISNTEAIIPLVTKLLDEKLPEKDRKPLLIIADDVRDPALAALITTKLDARTNFRVVAVVAPEFADRRKEALEDLAILTGGDVISADKKDDLREVQISQLGRAKKVIVSATHTVITPSYPDSEEIAQRCEAIKGQIEVEKNEFRKKRMQERLSKFTRGVAVINVGAATKTERDEMKERAIDAVYAAKAALAEGIVPGGGVALLNLAGEVGDETPAGKLIYNMLRAPFLTICKNAGIENPDEPKEDGWGIDVTTGKAAEMVKVGVTDPVKVTKLAVQHAVSVASMVMTTNVLISEIDDNKDVQKIKVVQE